MNVDAWMPYYGADYEGAMKGYRREVKWSYLAALWHYWNHTHAAGLPNNDSYLQCVCECPDADWIRTKGVIFSERPLFHLEGNMWHQDRAREEYAAALDRKQKAEQASKIAVKRRRDLGQLPPPDERSVEPSVEPSVERSVERLVANEVNQTLNRPRTSSPSPSPSPSPSSVPSSTPSPSQTHPPTPLKSAGSVSSQKQEFQGRNRFEWLERELCSMYKRPRPNVGRGEEEHLVAEVSRRPDVRIELVELRKFRSQSGEQYFPQSLKSLCQEWDKTLDRARNQKPAPKAYKEKSIIEKDLDRVCNEVLRVNP